jgi:hypothetical protein
MAKATDTTHRVVPLPEPLRQAMQQARAARGQTNAAFVTGAVADHLPGLVEGLQALGYGKLEGKRRPARLPFSEEAGTVRALRAASDQVQVPAVQLLLLCLAAATSDQPEKPKRQRGRRKKVEPADEESSGNQLDEFVVVPPTSRTISSTSSWSSRPTPRDCSSR